MVGWGSPFRRMTDILGISSNSMQKFGIMEGGGGIRPERDFDIPAVNVPLLEEESDERTQLDDYLDDVIRSMKKRKERLQLRRPRP